MARQRAVRFQNLILPKLILDFGFGTMTAQIHERDIVPNE
jgi:hypothetical protein